VYRATGLSVAYGRRQVLSDVSAGVMPGRVTVVIGPNGAGKSTLLKALCGDLEPSGGSVTLDGADIGTLPVQALAARRGVLPQAAQLSFPFTVHEVVRLGLDGERMSRAERAATVDAALEKVDLQSFGARFYQELSGGEQQRVHMARLICQIRQPAGPAGPNFLFLDEPTSSLDLKHQIMTLSIARDYARGGAGVLAILHDLKLAATFADEIVVVDKGRIHSTGAPEQVLNDALMRDVFGVAIPIAAYVGALDELRSSIGAARR
jgi:iron complex transport system ATP-binding protein